MNTLSPTTQALLKANASRGVSTDPSMLIRPEFKLLNAGANALKRNPQARVGHWLLPDNSCVEILRLIPAIVYSVFVEKAPDDDKPVNNYLVLPLAAKRDGPSYLLPDGNRLDHETHVAGIGSGQEGEIIARGTANKGTRKFNTEATQLLKKLGLPLYGTVWDWSSALLTNERGQSWLVPDFAFVGTVNDVEGVNESDILTAQALCKLVEGAIAEEKKARAAETAAAIERGRAPEGRIEITSDKGAIAPQRDPIDDLDIPF